MSTPARPGVSRALLLVFSVTMLLCLTVAGTAGGYKLYKGSAAGKWPGKKVTFFVAAKHYKAPTLKGAKAWNESGIGIRLVATKSRSRADVLVKPMPIKAFPGCPSSAFASVFGNGRGRFVGGQIDVLPVKNPGPECTFNTTKIMAHEFGHILGLDHEPKRCALMNESIQNLRPIRCPATPEGFYHCRIIEPDDFRGARKLYGGKAKPFGPQHCPLATTEPEPFAQTLFEPPAGG